MLHASKTTILELRWEKRGDDMEKGGGEILTGVWNVNVEYGNVRGRESGGKI